MSSVPKTAIIYTMTEAATPQLVRFNKFDGSSTQIQIVGEKYIGGGTFGKIYLADTLVARRPRRFVIKRYKGDTLAAERFAKKALTNYQRAKEAGLKVFPTYRMGEDGRSILMTDGHGDSTICLSNNRTLPELGIPQIANAAISPSLIEGVIAQAKKASEKRILIPNDAYFFIYDRSAQTTDFVIGDLDMLGKDLSSGHALWHNMRTAKNSLLSFVYSNAQNARYQANIVQSKFAEEGVLR